MVPGTVFTTALLGAIPLVSAHTRIYGAWINDQFQGDGRGVYVRTPPSNGPVEDLQSQDMNCGQNGGKAVPKFLKVAPGDQVDFEWFHDSRQDDIVDVSHQGGMATMITPYTDGVPTGPVWTKIAETGYDSKTKRWASDKIIANKGRMSFTVPLLAAGKYIIQQNLGALHEGEVAHSENKARGTQFYPNCVQVEVTGSGTAVPDQNFDMTGMTAKSPGVVFNVHSKFDNYPMYGPEVWKRADGAAGADKGRGTGAGAGAGVATAGVVTAGGGTGNGTGNGTTTGGTGDATDYADLISALAVIKNSTAMASLMNATGNATATATGAGTGAGAGCVTGKAAGGLTKRWTIGRWTFMVTRETPAAALSLHEKRADAVPVGTGDRDGSQVGRRGVMGRAFIV